MFDFFIKIFIKDYKNTKDLIVREKYGLLASFFGLISNLIVFLSKIFIGIFLGLFSIIGDSINNLSDFGNNALSIFGVKITSKKADDEHPFGHQRMEYIISLIISCVIIGLSFVMLYQGIRDLIDFIIIFKETGLPPTTTLIFKEFIITVIILLLALIIKLLQMFIYNSFGKRINSMQLKTLAKDSLNDCISTVLVGTGLLITYFTTYNVDCFFTIFVAILITISGISIMKEATTPLLGEKPDKNLINNLIKLIKDNDLVLGIHDLQIHSYGQNIFAVIHLEFDSNENVMKIHEICDEIERKAYEELKVNLTIHMDPLLINDEETNLYKNLVIDFFKSHYQKCSMHDFRLVSGETFVNLIFDLIIDNANNETLQNNIEAELKDFILSKNSAKQVYLVIKFDDTTSDFLYSNNK